ncbi:hypothetical protein MRX96_046360 [Rhipicephalus microplus]
MTSSGYGHRRDRIAVVADRPAHLVMPGPAAAVRSCCLPDPPTWILPARVPRGVVVPGDATLLPLLAPPAPPPPKRPRRGTPNSPRGGPFIAGVNCVVLVGIGWFRSTGVFTPYRPGATTSADAGRRCSVGVPPGPGGAAVPGRRLQHEVQRGCLDVSRAVGAPPRRIRARRSC